MENEIESQTDEFVDIDLDLTGLDDDAMFRLMRNYIVRNMSPASVSKFDAVVNSHAADDQFTLDEAVVAAVFNDALIQILEEELMRVAVEQPIPPFNI